MWGKNRGFLKIKTRVADYESGVSADKKEEDWVYEDEFRLFFLQTLV